MADRNTEGGKGGPDGRVERNAEPGINGKPGGETGGSTRSSGDRGAGPGINGKPGGETGGSTGSGDRGAGPGVNRPGDSNGVPADERMVLIHGFTREETIAVMRAAKTAVSDPQGVAFTTSTPTNLDWKLRDLIVEVREEHEYMRRNPPGASGQQQNPPGSDHTGGAGQAGQSNPQASNQSGQAHQPVQAGQSNPQASNQKGRPEGTGPSAPEKDR